MHDPILSVLACIAIVAGLFFVYYAVLAAIDRANERRRRRLEDAAFTSYLQRKYPNTMTDAEALEMMKAKWD